MADDPIQKFFMKIADISFKILVIVALFHVKVVHVGSLGYGATKSANVSQNIGYGLALSSSELPVASVGRPGAGPGHAGPALSLSTLNVGAGEGGSAGARSSLTPTAALGLSHVGQGLQARIPDWCTAYMIAYAKAGAKFMECAILHARPLSFCENCVDKYEIAVNILKEIRHQDKTRKPDPNMPAGSCMNSLLSSDMISIIGATDNFINSLWTDSVCSACFDRYSLVNGTVQYIFSNSTLEFEYRYNTTITCLLNFIQPPVNGSTNFYNETACDVCYELYKDLNDYYDTILSNGAVCMDIEDAINYTRNMWSKSFDCTLKQKDLAAVLTVTAVFCLLPIVFYSAAKFHGERQQMKILKQRRMSTASNLQGLAGSSEPSSPPSTVPQTDDEQTDDEVRKRMKERDVENDGETSNEASGVEHRPRVVFQI